MKLLRKVNESIYIMPTYGIVISSETGLDEETAVEISEGVIQKEMPLLDVKEKMLDFKPYEKSISTQVLISLTNDCNMLCQYCYYSSGGRKNEHLSKSDIDVVVQRLYKNAAILKLGGVNGVIVTVNVIGGGEPTLAWEQIEYLVSSLNRLKSSTKIDYFLSISTNGVLPEYKAQYLAENFHSIQVSFDCVEDIQNIQRPMFDGSPSYDLVEKTINYFDENGAKYGVNSVVSPVYYGRLFDMVDGILSRHKNMRFLKFELCMTDGRASGLSDAKSEAKEFLSNFLNIKEHFADRGTNIVSSYFSIYPRSAYCPYNLVAGSCIDANGNLLPCPKDIDVSKYSAGNIRDTKSHLNNGRHLYDEWYKPMLNCCSDCFAYYYCGSGCPLDIKRNSDGTYVKEDCNDLCALKKHFYHDIIQRIACSDSPKWVETRILDDYSTPSIKVMSYREK